MLLSVDSLSLEIISQLIVYFEPSVTSSSVGLGCSRESVADVLATRPGFGDTAVLIRVQNGFHLF